MRALNKLSKTKNLVIKSFTFYLPLLFGASLFHSDAIANQSRPEDFSDTKLHIMDIGKGQALILTHGCSVSLLDAGGEKKFIDHYLEKLKLLINERSVDNLNTVIISHSHGDHLRYVKPISESGFKTKFLIGNGTLLSKRSALKEFLSDSSDSRWIPISVKTDNYQSRQHTISSTDSCGKRDLVIDLLWGSLDKNDNKRSEYYKRHEENNNSVVVGIRTSPVPILILGDANKPAQTLLLNHARNELKRYKGAALVVGHHGYNNGVNEEFLKYIRPDSLYISRTANHPLRKKTFKKLIKAANLQPATRSHFINVECKSDNPKIDTLWGKLDSGIHEKGPGCPVITNRRIYMTSDQGNIELSFTRKNQLIINSNY